MTSRSLRVALVLAVSLACGTAFAIEFRSVSEAAILYDTPSEKGRKLSIIRAGTPVEIVVDLDKWVKVRDPAGALTWIDRRVLAEKRTVLVTAEQATVRQQATESAPPAFTAVRDVVLEVSGSPADGWIGVRHADGASGYLRTSEVWGL